MKKILITILLWLPLLAAAQNPLYFATQPAISPDAGRIYFCYDGGIWSVPSGGGTAARVTAMTGYQTSPKVSPDGQWLAFSADEQGNNNVYVTPVAGGEIRQLTFHQANDVVSGWSPDSKYVYFESNRYNNRTTYRVAVGGGTPEMLFDGYFNTVVHMAESPDGTFFFNNTSESFNFPTRKGYKGDNAPQIMSWNPSRSEFRQLTNYTGKDMWPSVDSSGRLYWATDQANGEYNLATLQDGKTKVLTSFSDGIRYPSVSHDGRKVVFMKDYMIHLYDVASGTASVPEIKVYEGTRTDISRSYTAEGRISAADISPDGKKLAFVSRGRLFAGDAKGMFVRELETTPEERVMEIVWGPDNKTIYYTRTRGGWYNLYKISAEERTGEEAVHTPDHMITSLTHSGDRSMIAFITGSDRIELLRPKNDKVEKLSDNEFWSFQGQSIAFSPDDKYLAYTAMNLFDRDIFICDLTSGKVTNLTNSATSENSPAWSPDGKYLYVTANRTKPSFPGGGRGNLYRIMLDYTSEPLEVEKYDELFEKEKKAGKEKKEKLSVSIDTRDVHRRWEPVQMGGNQYSVQVFKSGTKNFLVYSSSHEGAMGTYVQEIVDFDKKPAKKISGITTPSGFMFNGTNLFVLQRGDIYSVDLNAASAKKVEVKHSFSRHYRAEFTQMFHEVWALLAQNFYDPGYHGVDWKARKAYYEKFLPYVTSRSDLRTLTNDMLGELNSSHLGFNSMGDEERQGTSMRTMETGIIFSNGSPYTVGSVLKGSPAYPKDVDILPGDELIAVNGKKVSGEVNREYYFSSPVADREITLTLRRKGSEHDVTLHTTNTQAIRNMLYTKWEDDCRDRVESKTSGKVAYHHMRDMTPQSLEKFLIDMNTDAVHKEALILDLRYNNGGNVHQEVIDFLRLRSHFTWSYRDGQSNTHPNFTPGDQPLVVLINEQSLSDAEVTSNGIQTLEMAKLIGTETYRWIIFTSGASLVDGSSCRLPAWGCYNLRGEDMELAGVKPDIYIRNTFVDRLGGKDPQLDRAIEEILKDLAAK